MTEVAPIATAAGGAGVAGPAAAPAPSIASDFETFLRMLTTQIQNQDPLDPLDSAEFATQLATFSGVEQQVRTNDLLTDLGRQLGGGLDAAAAWIGREVRAPAPASFDGQPIRLAMSVPAAAESATLAVRDETGALVQRLPLQPGQTALTWRGDGPGGAPLPWGVYGFQVETVLNGVAQPPQTAETYGRVREVRMGPAGVDLVLPGAVTVDAGAVTAVRAADAPP